MKTLKEELMSHPPSLQQPKRRAQPQINIDAVTNWISTSWVDAAIQGFGAGAFETWQTEMIPILDVMAWLNEALCWDPYTIKIFNLQPTFWEANSTLNEVLCAFDEIWQLVKETWANHVTGGFRLGELGTDLIDGTELETLKEGQMDSKRETERTVWEIWANEVLEPYNLLGRTAEDWLKKILATRKEWQVFREILDAWHTENENSFRIWQDELEKSLLLWKKVCDVIHAWHVESPTGFIAWQVLKKETTPIGHILLPRWGVETYTRNLVS